MVDNVLVKSLVSKRKKRLLIYHQHVYNYASFFSNSHPFHYEYSLSNTVLPRTSLVRDLVVLWDDKLTLNDHYESVTARANRNLGLIYRLASNFSDPICLKVLYCSLVRPTLEYASTVRVGWILRFEKVQRRFTRFAFRRMAGTDAHTLLAPLMLKILIRTIYASGRQSPARRIIKIVPRMDLTDVGRREQNYSYKKKTLNIF